MYLESFTYKIQPQWPSLHFDDWPPNLKSICGNFNPRRLERHDTV